MVSVFINYCIRNCIVRIVLFFNKECLTNGKKVV